MALGRITIFRDKARALRNAYAVRDAFGEVWSRGHVVVAPVCMRGAPRIGRTNWDTHLIDCTAPGNLADATGLAVPWGRFGHLPRAIQLLGPPGSEAVLCDLAERLATQGPTGDDG
jgi:Asp-tRNA(Asn)/Glu-tRNA(Gln) amidotransferase A subunit family amidase